MTSEDRSRAAGLDLLMALCSTVEAMLSAKGRFILVLWPEGGAHDPERLVFGAHPDAMDEMSTALVTATVEARKIAGEVVQ